MPQVPELRKETHRVHTVGLGTTDRSQEAFQAV